MHEQIQPSVFAGGSTWMTMHILATLYEPKKRKAFSNFILCIYYIFICKKCSKHFGEFMRKVPLEKYLQNKDRLFLWTYLAHDNATRVKGEISPSYLDIKEYYFYQNPELESPCLYMLKAFATPYVPENKRYFVKLVQSIKLIATKERIGKCLQDMKISLDDYTNTNERLFLWCHLLEMKIFEDEIEEGYTQSKRYFFQSLGEKCSKCDE